MQYNIDPRRAREIADGLLAWYDSSRRDLPWRRTQDPYHIWICEIMAQQTRISFLLAYYERFIERFPTVYELSRADEAEVLKAWEGLGYYSRARNLQKAAKIIVSDFGGQVPAEKEALLALPGVGEYTAGAILSIAYGIPAPAVDGNVLRVFSRLECSDADIRLPGTKQAAAGFVRAVMPPDASSRFTQALMELGALVCVPKNPKCPGCPLHGHCAARDSGRQNALPVKTPKAPPELRDKTVVLLRNPRGEILMRKRSERLLSGLWEFLMLDGDLTEAALRAALEKLGHPPVAVRALGPARHVFTHMVWQMRGYDCQSAADRLPEGYQWIDEAGFRALPLPSALRFYTETAFAGKGGKAL